VAFSGGGFLRHRSLRQQRERCRRWRRRRRVSLPSAVSGGGFTVTFCALSFGCGGSGEGVGGGLGGRSIGKSGGGEGFGGDRAEA